MRLVFGVEYDGTEWNGWQTQICKNTVQDAIELALSKFASQKIKTICAGRTDSGVHAKCQVIHFDTKVKRQIWNWVRGTNSLLPKSIRIKWGTAVSDDFHARFSAKSRTYSYTICNTPIESPLSSRSSTWIYQRLSEKKMQDAANKLIGVKDFTCFRSAHCQSSSPIRKVNSIVITRENNYIYIDLNANSFLYNMVRNLIGSLALIGSGQRNIEWIEELLVSKDRKKAGKQFPASGLYLVNVEYDHKYNLN